MPETFSTTELDAMEKRVFTSADLDTMERRQTPTAIDLTHAIRNETGAMTRRATTISQETPEYRENLAVAHKLLEPLETPEQRKHITAEQVARGLVRSRGVEPPETPETIASISVAPAGVRAIKFVKLVASRTTPFDSEELRQLAELPNEYTAEAFDTAVRNVYAQPGPVETKEEQVKDITRRFSYGFAGKLQARMQNDPDIKATADYADEQRAVFGGKTWNRWNRTVAMMVGGGAHLTEELSRVATLGKHGDTAAEWAEVTSDLLNRPEMTPVVDNWFDQYVGGMAEMSGPVLTTVGASLITRRLAMIPRFAAIAKPLGTLGIAASMYSVDSNAMYQTAKHQGYPDDIARLRSVTGGLINLGIEFAGGSGEKYLKNDIVDAVTHKLGKARYVSRKIYRSALAEGLKEQIPQEAVSMVMGGDAPRLENGNIDWDKVADRFVAAGLSAALMGAAIAGPIAMYEAGGLPKWTEGQIIDVGPDTPAIPGRTYVEARQRTDNGTEGPRNPWIKQEPSKTNRDRVLLVQFASDLLTTGKEDVEAKAYYDKLHAQRSDHAVLGDTWEIPKWITEAAYFVPGADVYFVRDMAEAKQFLKSSGYQKVMFSALDINTPYIQELAKDYNGKVVVGGYGRGKETLVGSPNVTWYDSMPDMAKGEGYEYKPGVNLVHFEGSQVMPRLCMSKGCKHKCAFCVVTKQFEEMPGELIDQQIKTFAGLDTKLVYLDDKTFGQAKNHTMLPEIYWKIKEQNPEFEGFVVQTTATQFNRFSDEFLAASHIRYAELGVESYNDPILKELHKPASEVTIDQAAARARRLKIDLIPNIMVGLPGETVETYARTLAWLAANKDVISHVNAYNLALYAGMEITERIAKEKGGLTEQDLNENVVEKSYHENSQLHKDFASALYKFGSEALDKPPVHRIGLSADQEIAAKYGVEPGRVEILLKQAEDRYRELKAKKTEDRKGKNTLQPVVPVEGKWQQRKDGSWGTADPKVIAWVREVGAKAARESGVKLIKLTSWGRTQWHAVMGKSTPATRVVTGEHAELAFLSRSRNDIEAILADITSPNPVTALSIPEKVEPTRPLKVLQEMGHGIAQQLGMTEEERRLDMVRLTGKNTMKGMETGQAEQYVQYLEGLLRERSETYDPKPTVFYEMLDGLQNQTRPERIEEEQGVKDTLNKLGQGLTKVGFTLTRMDRFFTWLDGGKENGPFKRTFWRTTTRANGNRHDAVTMHIAQWDDFLQGIEAKPGEMLRVEQVSDHLALDRWSQIGVVMRHMNENGQKWNTVQGIADQDVEDIYRFWGGKNSKEARIADYLFEFYNSYWPVLRRTAISVGIDEKTLKQEFLYSPIILKGIPLDQQNSLLDYFENQVLSTNVKPEQGFLKQRTGPTKGIKLENNAALMFFNMVNRFATFEHMAPVAYSLSQTLHDPAFVSALDRATYGRGTKLVNDWLRQAVRGHGDTINHEVYRMFKGLSHAGAMYALGWNVPSVLRQAAGALHTIAADPRMMTEWPLAVAQSVQGGYRQMAEEARSKSAMLRHRIIDEIMTKPWTKRSLKQRYGKDVDFDELAMKQIRYMDSWTVVTSWTALYRSALKSGKPDATAVEFADDWITRTQEMGEAIYTPDLMRNGPVGALYRLLFPFTNAVNNEFNLWRYDNLDPIREKGLRHGLSTTAYRYLWTWVIPGLVFGVIRRGRLQRDKKETVMDIATYPVSPLLMVGDWAMSAVSNEGARAKLYESGFQTAAATIKAAQKGNWKAVFKNAARTVALLGGAVTPYARGIITAQTVRTVEAAYDLAFAKKKPSVKSLVVGEYAAKQNEPKKKKVRR